jgi:cytidylate kinase
LNNEDVTDAIRIPVVNEYVARISAFLSVRSFLRAQQKAMATNGAVVMDGRDMGSVVIPDAELKVFLECSLDERARRRYTEMQAK